MTTVVDVQLVPRRRTRSVYDAYLAGKKVAHVRLLRGCVRVIYLARKDWCHATIGDRFGLRNPEESLEQARWMIMQHGNGDGYWA